MSKLPESTIALRIRGRDRKAVFTTLSIGLVGAQIVHRETGEPVGPAQFTEMPVATKFDVDVFSEPVVWPNAMAGTDGDEGVGLLPNGRCETHSWHRQAASRAGLE